MATPTISTTGNAAAIPNSAVAVVVNTNDADSVAIGAYYNAQRPGSLTCDITCAPGMPPLAYTDFNANVLAPVRTFLAAHSGIEYLAMTKGISAQTDSQAGGNGTLRCSTDSKLMQCLLQGSECGTDPSSYALNPYYSLTLPFKTRFSASSAGFPLVTRLDAATRARALMLIDNATAARPWAAMQLIAAANGGGVSGYTPDTEFAYPQIKRLRAAGDYTTGCTLNQVWETRYTNLIGWWTYGVYGPGYSTAALAAMKFLPGAIMDVFNSYSGFSLFGSDTYGHVQPETLIPQGITGAHCHVEEGGWTFLDAATMFNAYRNGLTLAESMWAANYSFGFKDLVLGDPICAPYHS